MSQVVHIELELTSAERAALQCDEGGRGFSRAVRDHKRAVLNKLRAALSSSPEQGGGYVYLASSWRNEEYPAMLARFRQEISVYDFRDPERAFDWRQIDPQWDGGPISMERYKRLLDHPRAVEGFEADMNALRSARAVVLLNPCGASAHLEAGWAVGVGKPLYVLTEPEQRPDLMYRMAELVTSDPYEILAALKKPQELKVVAQSPAPALSDKERERLEEIADFVETYAPEKYGSHDRASFLRNLASREQGDRVWDENRQLWVDPPEHLERPEVPEEIKESYREAGRDASVFEDDTDPDYLDLISDAAVADAAPAIRKQERERFIDECERNPGHLLKDLRARERQRVREALLRVTPLWPEQVAARTGDQDEWIRRKAALDSLEDDDG